jgi:hypothetical protein
MIQTVETIQNEQRTMFTHHPEWTKQKRSKNNCCSRIWTVLKWMIFFTSLFIVVMECIAVSSVGPDASLTCELCRTVIEKHKTSAHTKVFVEQIWKSFLQNNTSK